MAKSHNRTYIKAGFTESLYQHSKEIHTINIHCANTQSHRILNPKTPHYESGDFTCNHFLTASKEQGSTQSSPPHEEQDLTANAIAHCSAISKHLKLLSL